MKTIIVDDGSGIEMTDDEFDAWCIYDKNHDQLTRTTHGYESTLNMFLSHYRRGINLNEPREH